jgi:hypothetical protein
MAGGMHIRDLGPTPRSREMPRTTMHAPARVDGLAEQIPIQIRHGGTKW